jgi:hypothetical protein
MLEIMDSNNLLRSLVYLDRDFISRTYETFTGISPETLITKNQGKKAGAGIPIFSAEISASETRTFPVSTLGMLVDVYRMLDEEQTLSPDQFKSGMRSVFGWVHGELTTVAVASTKLNEATGMRETSNNATYFAIRGTDGLSLALITTPEYFDSGLDTLAKMHNTLLKELSIPVRALVRVIAASSYMNQWVAIPLVVLEKTLPLGLYRKPD